MGSDGIHILLYNSTVTQRVAGVALSHQDQSGIRIVGKTPMCGTFATGSWWDPQPWPIHKRVESVACASFKVLEF